MTRGFRAIFSKLMQPMPLMALLTTGSGAMLVAAAVFEHGFGLAPCIKYTTAHLLKWLFLFGLLMSLPITSQEFSAVSWATLPFEAIWRIGYVIVGTTFLTYLLNVYALKQLKASTIGVFTYLQPLIGIAYAIVVGADVFTPSKLIAAVVVLMGVYLVTKRYEARV